MKKIVMLGVALVLALVPLSSVRATEMDARALERIVTDLESVIGRIEGVDFTALKVRSHGQGLYSVAIPMPEATRKQLLSGSSSQAADFKTMATGLSLSEPSSFSALITAASCLDDTFYNFWFVVGNARPTDQFKRTTFQLKGPGDKFKIVDTLVYDALSLVVFFTEQLSGDVGFHTIQIKVTSGGKIKTIVLCQ